MNVDTLTMSLDPTSSAPPEPASPTDSDRSSAISMEMPEGMAMPTLEKENAGRKSELADRIRPFVFADLVTEIQRTNPDSASFKAEEYVNNALDLFFNLELGETGYIQVPTMRDIAGKFLFSCALQTTHPAGYQAYSAFVKKQDEDSDSYRPRSPINLTHPTKAKPRRGGTRKMMDLDSDDEDTEMEIDMTDEESETDYRDDDYTEDGSTDSDGSDYTVDKPDGRCYMNKPVQCDSGYHSPTMSRKIAQLSKSATPNAQGEDPYHNCPVIVIRARPLVNHIRNLVLAGFPTDARRVRAMWDIIICLDRVAINGRSIVEENLLNGQLDVLADGDCIDIGPLVNFRNLVFARPHFLMYAQQNRNLRGVWIVYEWLTIAHFVLKGLEKARVEAIRQMKNEQAERVDRVARDTRETSVLSDLSDVSWMSEFERNYQNGHAHGG